MTPCDMDSSWRRTKRSASRCSVSGACSATRTFRFVRMPRTGVVAACTSRWCTSASARTCGFGRCWASGPAWPRCRRIESRLEFIEAICREFRRAAGRAAIAARILVGGRDALFRYDPVAGMGRRPTHRAHVSPSRSADGNAADAQPRPAQQLRADRRYRRIDEEPRTGGLRLPGPRGTAGRRARGRTQGDCSRARENSRLRSGPGLDAPIGGDRGRPRVSQAVPPAVLRFWRLNRRVQGVRIKGYRFRRRCPPEAGLEPRRRFGNNDGDQIDDAIGRTVRRGRDRPATRGRPCRRGRRDPHVQRARRGHPAQQLRELPPAEPGGADVAAVVPRGAAVGAGHQGEGRLARDAAVVRRPAVRRVLQRLQPERRADRDDRRLGRRRRAAGRRAGAGTARLRGRGLEPSRRARSGLRHRVPHRVEDRCRGRDPELQPVHAAPLRRRDAGVGDRGAARQLRGDAPHHDRSGRPAAGDEARPRAGVAGRPAGGLRAGGGSRRRAGRGRCGGRGVHG